MSDYFDLGTYTRAVTTRSGQAHEWVRRGLLWAYAFNHEEAVTCFKQAVAADQDCALAYWGLAYALGPNYNKQWEMFDPEEARSAIAQAHGAAMVIRPQPAGGLRAEVTFPRPASPAEARAPLPGAYAR